MSMMKDFKDFAMKGNLIDMAVGIILGAAFGKIVASLVGDMLMPFVGMMMGGLDFSSLFFPLVAEFNGTDVLSMSIKEIADNGVPVVRYGKFIQTIIDFLIVAFTVFIVVRMVTKKPDAPAEPAPPADDIVLLTEIRDALKRK